MQTYPPGTRIGQYEIASRPMIGGMGVVYFALDHGNDGRPVALKTFRPELLPDRAARDRFLREGTAWVELGRHPHIVRCYKVEYIDPTAFLILELIAKEQNMPDASLRSWLIPGRPLPLEQALLFALQIARGMQHATEKIPGFVHRDLKPENLLVGADRLPGTNINRLRVTDFGLAKTLTDGGALPVIGNVDELRPNQIQFTRGVGTPLYMAPEQWTGESVSIFTDVYAFGCILYEMLSGQHAANGQTIVQLQESHRDGRLRPLPVNLPTDVASLVTKCLVLNPTLRHESWSEITNELENVYAGHAGKSAIEVVISTDLGPEDHRRTSSSYTAMGHAYLDIGKSDIAVGYFEKALSIQHDIGDRRGEGKSLGYLGVAYDQLGNPRRAVGYHEQYLAVARELVDGDDEASALNNLGNAYSHLGDVRQAISYFEQALAIRREIGDWRGEGNALGNLANAHSDLGDARQAIDNYEQALALMREIGDQRGEGTALGGLSRAYADLGDVQRAISYHQQALAIYRTIGDRRGEGKDLFNLGSAYADLGDMGRAIGYFEQSLAIMREIGDQRGEGSALANLGSAYAALGNLPQAIINLEKARGIQGEIGDIDGVAFTSFNISLLYAGQGDPARALPLAQEAMRIWTQIGSPYSERAQQLLAELQGSNQSAFYRENPVQAAFEAFQRADSLQVMQLALDEYPFMKDVQFILGVERVIKEQVLSEHKPAFEQRLAWLKQLARK